MSAQLILILIVIFGTAAATAINVERKQYGWATWDALICLFGIALCIVYFCKP